MGYQESWLYVEPQRQFNKLIRAYEKAEQEGYYEVRRPLFPHSGRHFWRETALYGTVQADSGG